jgi:hypothetical protein
MPSGSSAFPGGGSEGYLNGAGTAGWLRESGSRLRQSRALGSPCPRGPVGSTVRLRDVVSGFRAGRGDAVAFAG